MKKNLIFILGDSRTGTSSLHSFLKALGFNSIHYYMVEAKQEKQKRDENWINLKKFINESTYNAFSDYPTRSFYKEIDCEYNNAKFILCTRRSIDIWKKSMESFFSKFKINLNISELEKTHIQKNEEIRQYFRNQEDKFLEICIDDEIILNSEKIKKFLNIQSKAILGWENKSIEIKIEKPSCRKILYSTNDNKLHYLKNLYKIDNALLSEYGWIYLINDTNDFLSFYYGLLTWSDTDLKEVINKFSRRESFIKSKKTLYFKFIIPEKIVIYSEFAPKILENMQEYKDRPAKLMSKNIPNVYYLDTYLKDLKSYGNLYFRGDTHTTWLGSYYIYRYIIEKINKDITKSTSPIHLNELDVSIAKYLGDLYKKLDYSELSDLNGVWGPFNLKDALSYDIKYFLSEKKNKCKKVKIDEIHAKYATNREVFIYENEDTNLPRCVVFRDSTADFILELLAQHFSRIVYIWHSGNIYEDIIDYERPNFVLHIMAERFVLDYPKSKPTYVTKDMFNQIYQKKLQ